MFPNIHNFTLTSRVMLRTSGMLCTNIYVWGIYAQCLQFPKTYNFHSDIIHHTSVQNIRQAWPPYMLEYMQNIYSLFTHTFISSHWRQASSLNVVPICIREHWGNVYLTNFIKFQKFTTFFPMNSYLQLMTWQH